MNIERAEIEDIIAGWAVGMSTWVLHNNTVFIVPIITAALWWAGGRGLADTNSWRRIGIPFVLALTFAFSRHAWTPLLAFPLMWGSLAIGYGIPSTQPPDDGSWLGRRLGRWTRPVWYLILCFAMVPLFI